MIARGCGEGKRRAWGRAGGSYAMPEVERAGSMNGRRQVAQPSGPPPRPLSAAYGLLPNNAAVGHRRMPLQKRLTGRMVRE